ncbi:MAG: sugar-binding protein [Planctomycetota bacterium]
MMLRKLFYLVSTFIVVGLICPVIAQEVDMEIGFAVQPPVIDGEVDGIWDGASSQYFVPLADPADGSGIWKALYDAENLYVLVDVTDDSLQNDSAGSWQDDSVEIYFDGGNTKLSTALSGDDHQYTFGWTTDEIQGTNITGYTEGIEQAQVTTATGWRIEVKMPWMSIWGVVPQAGDLIGIDCYYNDDDDGGDSREDKMLGFSAVEGWNDASQWGTAVLAAEPEPEPTGPKVIYVSFHGADDAPSAAAAAVGFTEASDKGYTDLLTANGYNVTRYITTSTPDAEVLNAADLVIISRAVSSGGYSNDGATAWNNISAPMMIMGGYVLRNSRMGYTTGGTMVDTTGDIKLTVSDATHPIFAGIPLTGGTMNNSYAGGAVVLPTDGVTVSRGISINNDPADDEGTVLATIAEASADTGPVGGMVIAEWPAGAMLEHSGGAGTDVLAGPRLVFLTGSREPDGVTGGDAAGLYDLYDDGAQMFLNAVEYMIPVKVADVTAPGDAIQGVPNDGDWPGAETPDLAIDDNTGTKFLHFKGEIEPTGFQVTPSVGPSIVTGLTLTAANDAVERDPVSFELYGSNVSIDGPYELIAVGDIVDFAQADAWPRFTMNATPISFDNDVAYAHYQVLFPAVRDAASANSMQIAEVELLGVLAPPAGPIVHYKLDDGEGVIAVDSADGLDGILMGDPQWSAGVFDGALDFDGDGDYVDCGTSDALNNLSDAMTVSAWVSIRSVSTTWMGIVMKGETAWRLGVNGDTTGIHWGFTGGARGWQAANSVTELPLNEWHHIAGTYDRSVGGTVYVDGVAETVNPDPDGVATNEMPLLLGENPEALGRFFDGILDDVRIYNRALSADELSGLAPPPRISCVVRGGGGWGDRDPVGPDDGSTTPLATEPGGLMDGNMVYSDRTYPWFGVPAEYVGSEYIRTFNSDKNGGTVDVTYEVTISRPAIVWITVDDRIPAEWDSGGTITSQQDAVDRVTAAFAAAGTFTDTGIDLYVHENDTTDRQMSVFAAELSAGTYVFGSMDSGKNFYNIGAVE